MTDVFVCTVGIVSGFGLGLIFAGIIGEASRNQSAKQKLSGQVVRSKLLRNNKIQSRSYERVPVTQALPPSQQFIENR